ncbi:hypothetical protein TPHA_0H01680 [Tetrapisispora phaffii CBS 4417]|uniref:Spindle pole body component 110 n=1 Tax=Tetrapisispora phaffii (strain ATCC 24235 / CBS 4417 / NBRC 1672 / NRRL Y-8282 / UCD 70-5) TaxID=1071381 RepID=G8BX70_TETPH|nr:hypothetical protein TPHA_0H01680 [Tetrapisispora phaffii CBS 4417]CCE64374.1 hypothetical protein TPHA_0H01680 [Tetrapisispora phaffii CBS 4417]
MSQSKEHSQRIASLEFTPIGQAKQAPKRPLESPTHNNGTEDIRDTTLNSPPRKYQKINPDDTLNSVNMFNESLEFDEVIPELSNTILSNSDINRRDSNEIIGRNLVNELKENASTSNPLKEQQEQIQSLIKENYNLKAKVTSLLKYLNTVMNKGELQKTLPLLDEINELKVLSGKKDRKIQEIKIKCDDLVTQNNILIRKSRELEALVASKNESATNSKEIDIINGKNQKIIEELETKLSNAKEDVANELNMTISELNDLKIRYNKFEKTIMEKDKLINAKDDLISSLEGNLEEITTEVENLQDLLRKKEEVIKEYKDKCNTMLEKNHDDDNNEQFMLVQDELNMKLSEIENLELELNDLKDLNTKLKESLNDKENELTNVSSEYEKYKLDAEAHMGIMKDSDDKLKNQVIEIRKKNIELNSKLLQMNEVNENLNDELMSLKDIIEKLEQDKKAKLQELKSLKSSDISQIEDLKQNNLTLERKLKENLDEKNVEINKLRRQHVDMQKTNSALVDKLTKESQSLRKEYEDKINDLENQLKSNITDLSTNKDLLAVEYNSKMDKLNKELEENKHALKTSEEIIKDLKNQLIENVTNSSQKLAKLTEAKNSEIESLLSQMESLRNKYRKKTETLINEQEEERQSYIRKLREEKLSTEREKDNYDKLLLQFNSEKNAIINSKKELEDNLNNKINSLEKLLQQTSSTDVELETLKSELRGKELEIKELYKKVKSVTDSKEELNSDYLKIRSINRELKVELKKIVDEYNDIAKKYRTLNDEFINNSKAKNGLEEAKANLLILQSKYNMMKKDFLNRLEELGKENVELENKVNLLSSGSRPSTSEIKFEDSTSQNRADYYRLKYNNEVRLNNDLRVMNDYLNRVMRASSQQLRLDLLKLGNEKNSNYLDIYDNIVRGKTDINGDYDPYYSSHNYPPTRNDFLSNDRKAYRRKFKSIAMMILSCIRMRNVASTSRMNKMKVDYLQKKIAMDNDRITW